LNTTEEPHTFTSRRILKFTRAYRPSIDRELISPTGRPATTTFDPTGSPEASRNFAHIV
jgi:hypothetical protein